MGLNTAEELGDVYDTCARTTAHSRSRPRACERNKWARNPRHERRHSSGWRSRPGGQNDNRLPGRDGIIEAARSIENKEVALLRLEDAEARSPNSPSRTSRARRKRSMR